MSLAALVGEATASEPLKLRLSSQLPASSHQGVSIAAFRERVDQRTSGAIQIDVMVGERAIGDLKVGTELSAGTIDLALINISTLAAKVPAIEFIEQPFLLNFDAVVRAIADPARPVRPIIDGAVLDAMGIRILWWVPFGSNVVFSKGIAAATVPNIAGRKVRTASDAGGAFLTSCNAKPVVISPLKLHDAMKAGEVDLAVSGVAVVKTRELWKVTDTITLTQSSPFEFVIAVNEKLWQSLRSEQRDVIATAAREGEQELRDKYPSLERADLDFAREKGMKVVALQRNEVEEWRACSWPVLEQFLQRTGTIGFNLMAAYGQVRTDPCCSSPDAPPTAK